MIKTSDVLVVVPAFNEESSLGKVLTDLKLTNFDVLVVSDGSTDSTVLVARSLNVPVIDLTFNLGVGGALRAGFKYAEARGYSAIVQIDADGQHPVRAIDDLLNEANRTKAHMVIGSRFLTQSTTMKVSIERKIMMKFLALSASKAARKKITDSSSGCRIICQPLLGQFARHFSNSYLGDTYGSVISAGRAGYKITEIPVPISSRLHGESTASTRHAISSILKVVGTAILRLHLRIETVQTDLPFEAGTLAAPLPNYNPEANV